MVPRAHRTGAGPSLIMNSHVLCEPFGGYSKTHSMFFSSDDKYTVLGIVSVTSWMIVIFPLRILVDSWLWKWCFSEETGSATDVCEQNAPSPTQLSRWLPEIRCPLIPWGLDPIIFRDSWLQKAFSFPLKWGLPPEIGVSHVGSMQLGRKWLAVQWGTFLVAQWLRLHGPNAEGLGSIPDQGTKIPRATTKNLHAWTKMGDPICCN